MTGALFIVRDQEISSHFIWFVFAAASYVCSSPLALFCVYA